MDIEYNTDAFAQALHSAFATAYHAVELGRESKQIRTHATALRSQATQLRMA